MFNRKPEQRKLLIFGKVRLEMKWQKVQQQVETQTKDCIHFCSFVSLFSNLFEEW